MSQRYPSTDIVREDVWVCINTYVKLYIYTYIYIQYIYIYIYTVHTHIYIYIHNVLWIHFLHTLLGACGRCGYGSPLPRGHPTAGLFQGCLSVELQLRIMETWCGSGSNTPISSPEKIGKSQPGFILEKTIWFKYQNRSSPIILSLDCFFFNGKSRPETMVFTIKYVSIL